MLCVLNDPDHLNPFADMGVPSPKRSSWVRFGLPYLVASAALLLGCASQERDADETGAATTSSPQARDSAAVAALIASDKWSAPSCRWLEHGVWVLAYPQETALYRAAAQAGYIRMETAGQDNRTGAPEPAWRITLTEAGKTQAAACGPTSKPDTWGVTVSRRELISATYVGESPAYAARKVYDVEYRWVPTSVGERVKRVLTGTMAVQEGRYRTRVYLLNSPEVIDPSGWYVDQIDDLGAERIG